MVKTLPFADIHVPSPGFGAMGLSFGLGSNLTLEEAEPVLLKAIELGCTFWDTAVVYQAGINEKLLGALIKKHNVRDKSPLSAASMSLARAASPTLLPISGSTLRERLNALVSRRISTISTELTLTLPSKSQSRPWMQSARPERPSISGSLNARLRPCERRTQIMSPLTFHQRLLDTDRFVVVARIDAIQAEYSAFETIHETDGLIDTAKELGIAYVAYSPLGHGWLVDNFDYKTPDDFAPDDFRRKSPKFQGENFYKNRAIVEEIKKLAVKKGVSVSQIALAWVAAQGTIAIPGTTKAKRLEENWASREIEFSEEEQKEMRKIIDVAKPSGNRYGPEHQAMVGH